MLLVVACVGSSDPSLTPYPTRIKLPEGRVALPDYEPCRAGDNIPCVDTGRALNGVLHEANRCVWYVLENGDDVRVVWPLGYSASFDPFVVYNNSGAEVARDDSSLVVGGAGPSDGESDACGRSRFVSFVEPVTRSGLP